MSDVAPLPGAGIARRDLAHFLLRRLHSLTGVLPLGVFLIEHFYTNYQAVGPGGAERFDRVVHELQQNPIIVWVEILGIGLPILYHAFYGLFIALEAKSNVGRYGYGANWRFLFQRVTGVLLVLFIGYHVWMTRLRPVFEPQIFAASGGLVSFEYMRGYLNAIHVGVPIWIVYILGVLCACYHFANGLWGFLIHWGVTTGPRAQRVAGYGCVALGLVLAAVGLNSLYAFIATGGL